MCSFPVKRSDGRRDILPDFLQPARRPAGVILPDLLQTAEKHRGGDDRCPPDALPGLSRKKPRPSAFRQKGRGIRSRGSTLFEPAYCRNHFFLTITESPGRIGAAPRWSSDRSVTEDFQLMSSSLGPSLSYSSHQRFGFSDLYYIRLEPVVNRKFAPQQAVEGLSPAPPDRHVYPESEELTPARLC